MRKIHECAEDIKNILNDAERTEEVDGDMLCSINELVDEILSIYCLEKQQRKMAIAEENEILSEEAKKADWLLFLEFPKVLRIKPIRKSKENQERRIIWETKNT